MTGAKGSLTLSGSSPAPLWKLARNAMRTQLWPLPTVGVLVALAFGVLAPRIDARVDDHLPAAVTSYLFGGGASAARTMLDAVASSLITVTSLTFSLTVVTLQLASSQFSPRLLRTFTRDLVVQGTLALFLGTFTFAITVLRTVRTADESTTVFVPQLSVTIAFVLTILSVIALVVFLAHLVRTIRVESMLQTVYDDALATIEQTLAGMDDPAPALPQPPPSGAIPVLAATSGFVVRVKSAELVDAAADADAVCQIDCYPGASIVAGTPIGLVWSDNDHATDHDALDTLLAAARDAVVTGFERTESGDVAFGLRQLTDVAVKALSPGINDPTTALHALGHSAALLCELSERALGPRPTTDSEDVVRLVTAAPTLADLLATAVDQPRRYGSSEPQILDRLFMLLRELAWRTDTPQHAPIHDQLRRLRAVAREASFDPTDQHRLTTSADLAQDALAHTWQPNTRTS